MLAEVDSCTLSNTLVEVNTKVLIDDLADTVSENEARTLIDAG